MARYVQLLGSVPLSSAEMVFREVARRLGPLAKRIPDGETGVRSAWTVWQQRVIEKVDGVEKKGERNAHGLIYSRFGLRSNTRASELNFGSLGYARAAIDSYTVFARLQKEGVIKDARFQVSLPTPLAVVWGYFIGQPEFLEIYRAYERSMFNELDEILSSIPNDQLSIQWDLAVEFHQVWDNRNPESETAKLFSSADLISHTARLSDYIPAPVELGWHFCYGDAGHKHYVEPRDAGVMTSVANQLTRATNRAASWLHFPVPRDRVDHAFFAPLAQLKLNPATELYLGLIHFTDGVEGTRQRMTASNSVITNYGVATECGFGRRPPETILQLLDLHRTIAEL